jgi:hypothetical protein
MTLAGDAGEMKRRVKRELSSKGTHRTHWGLALLAALFIHTGCGDKEGGSDAPDGGGDPSPDAMPDAGPPARAWQLERVDDVPGQGELALTSDGVLWAVYERDSRGIYASRRDEAGWSEPEEIAVAVGDGMVARPSVVAVGRELHVAWDQFELEVGGQDSMLYSVRAEAGDWSEPVDLMAGPFALHPRLVADGSGEVAVVYGEVESAGTRVRVAWIDGGQLVDAHILFDLDCEEASAVFDPDDRLHVVAACGLPDRVIHYVSGSRSTIATATVEFLSGGINHGDAALAVDPNGGVHVAFAAAVSGCDSAPIFQMHYSAREEFGSFAPAVRVSDTCVRESYASLAIADDGTVVLVYAQYQVTGIHSAESTDGQTFAAFPLLPSPDAQLSFPSALVIDPESGSWHVLIQALDDDPEPGLWHASAPAP